MVLATQTSVQYLGFYSDSSVSESQIRPVSVKSARKFYIRVDLRLTSLIHTYLFVLTLRSFPPLTPFLREYSGIEPLVSQGKWLTLSLTQNSVLKTRLGSWSKPVPTPSRSVTNMDRKQHPRKDREVTSLRGHPKERERNGTFSSGPVVLPRVCYTSFKGGRCGSNGDRHINLLTETPTPDRGVT